MRKLYLPIKFRNHGLHIYCTHKSCKKVVTKAVCKHVENQRFQSRIYNPHTKRQDCIKSYDTKDASEAFAKHLEYKEYLVKCNFQKEVKNPVTVRYQFIKECTINYLNFLKDIDVPKYERKNRSRQYITDEERYLYRFLKLIQSIEGQVSKFPVTAISPKHVEAWDEYVVSLELSNRSYNAHIKSVRYLFDHIIKRLEINIKNPFERVSIRSINYDPEIITVDEFEKLLSLITHENGKATKGKNEKPINYYRPWLAKVFVFSLLVGERRDRIVLLRWSDIKDNYIGIPNWKVNRSAKTTKQYISYTPITKDLAEILTQFDVAANENEFIVAPEMTNRNTLKQLLTNAFSHYWKQTGSKKKVTFKNLRKTYITRITDLIGEKAMFIKHGNDKTSIKHYLDKKELISETRNLKLYDISNWLHNTNT